jgi:hypothetical protein
MSPCPHCHFENRLGAPVCQSCGAKLSSWGTLASQPAVSSGARPQVTVRVVRADGGPELAYSLRKDEAVAGTAGEILLMDDPFVAREQARFFFDGPSLMVEDVGDVSGVYTRLKGERPLEPNQELRCGRQRLKYEPLPPAETTTPRVWGSPDSGCRGRLVQILEGGLRADAFPLRDGENLLGREHGDIAFPGDGFVSGRHALFIVRASGVKIRDLGSSNGTFLRIDKPTRLEVGDQLLIGRQLLKMEFAG